MVGLIGQYSSCPHVLAYAARHPDLVNRIVLFGGAARSWLVMSAPSTQALLSLIEQDWDLFVDTAAHQWFGWSAGGAAPASSDAIDSAFWGACHAGRQDAAEYLLARGASVNWIPAWEKLTPLDAAERTNADELAGWLREHGARSAAELTP